MELKDVLKFVLQFEGGYVNDPADSGGATNFGVTQRSYDAWRAHRGLGSHPVRNIAMQEVEALYDQDYWVPSHAKWMEAPLALAMMDTAVNFGVGGAIRFLGEALGIHPFAAWMPETSAAIHTCDQAKVALKIVDLRIAHRHDRVKQKPSQAKFLKGWLNRDNALRKEVLALS